jgi:hypothetical protein
MRENPETADTPPEPNCAIFTDTSSLPFADTIGQTIMHNAEKTSNLVCKEGGEV